MLDNTRKVFDDTVKELRLSAFLTTVLSQLVVVAYLIYAVTKEIGNAALNIAMAVISLIYALASTVVYFVNDKQRRKALKEIQNNTRIFKFAAKTLTLAVSIYSIAISADKVDAIAIILATLSIVLWLVQLILEISTAYVKYKSNVFMDSFKKDFAPVISACTKVRDKVVDAVEVGTEIYEDVKTVARGVAHGVGKIASLGLFGKKNRLGADQDDYADKTESEPSVK